MTHSADFWHITIMPEYKPGDLPPEGYLQWHEWAEVQLKAGIKQTECPTCCLWRTPQELSTREVTYTAFNPKRGSIQLSAFQCAKCFEKECANADPV